jgi:uncharacterized protein YxeA
VKNIMIFIIIIIIIIIISELTCERALIHCIE